MSDEIIVLNKKHNTIKLKKKENLTKLQVNLYWRTPRLKNDEEFDLDLHVAFLDDKLGLQRKQDLLYWDQQSVYGGTSKHLLGDNKSGSNDPNMPAESCLIDLNSVPDHIHFVKAILEIYFDNEPDKNLKQIEDLKIEIINANTGKVFAVIDTSDLDPKETDISAELFDIIRTEDGWDFRSISVAHVADLGDYLQKFNYLNVSRN